MPGGGERLLREMDETLSAMRELAQERNALSPWTTSPNSY